MRVGKRPVRPYCLSPDGEVRSRHLAFDTSITSTARRSPWFMSNSPRAQPGPVYAVDGTSTRTRTSQLHERSPPLSRDRRRRTPAGVQALLLAVAGLQQEHHGCPWYAVQSRRADTARHRSRTWLLPRRRRGRRTMVAVVEPTLSPFYGYDRSMSSNK